ncbi:hypothetical protein BYT27DRAFT_6844810 [Phlegmacium glaucopus]|nr:hypothetical protein BYT27DRAFT_6844810 [Phlegmacium glaucopus]
MNRPLLTDLPLDVQIHICQFLHPSQILALRQTCKAIHEAISQRIIWIHALNRICRENLLFLPTFPIAAMSMAELERAATAPLRWIALSSSKDRNNDEVLHPRRTRVIENPLALMIKTLQPPDLQEWGGFADLYLVPGGRYLVASGPHSLGVWDLGFISDGDMSDDGKPMMWATRVNTLVGFRVHPTPDGLGIRILTYSYPPWLTNVLTLYIFEIYPEKETPELTKIARLMLDLPEQEPEYAACSLNRNTVVIYNRVEGTVIVWDFVANTAANWFISNASFMDEVIKVTETTFIMTHAHPPCGYSRSPL